MARCCSKNHALEEVVKGSYPGVVIGTVNATERFANSKVSDDIHSVEVYLVEDVNYDILPALLSVA